MLANNNTKEYIETSLINKIKRIVDEELETHNLINKDKGYMFAFESCIDAMEMYKISIYAKHSIYYNDLDYLYLCKNDFRISHMECTYPRSDISSLISMGVKESVHSLIILMQDEEQNND